MGERMEGGRGGGTAEGREDVRRREGGKEEERWYIIGVLYTQTEEHIPLCLEASELM